MKRTIVRLVVVVAVVAVGVLFGVKVRNARRARAKTVEPEVPPAPVAVARAARRDLTERVTLTGVIRPRNEVEVFPKLPGRLEKVLVNVGDRVEAGQPLAVIEHREISWQHRQAAAQLKAARAMLEQAKVNAEAARVQYERFKALLADSAVPRAEFERVEAAYNAAAAAVRAAEGQVALAEAAAGLAGEALKNATIVSPIAGTVTRKNVNVGTQVAPMAPVFQVQDVAALKLDGTVTAAEYTRLRVDQAARVEIDDLPGTTFPGTIATISPTLDPMTRRAAVEITIANPDGRLLPNMFARVRVDVGARAGVLAIPEAAVVTLPAGRAVFVVRDGPVPSSLGPDGSRGKIAQVKPVLGLADGEWIAVESGLAEGDVVAVSGHASLADGAAVLVTEGGATAPTARP